MTSKRDFRASFDVLRPGMVTVVDIPSDENSSFVREPALEPARIRGALHSGSASLKLNILQLDAHPDLYDEYEGNRYSHACPFARIIELN